MSNPNKLYGNFFDDCFFKAKKKIDYDLDIEINGKKHSFGNKCLPTSDPNKWSIYLPNDKEFKIETVNNCYTCPDKITNYNSCVENNIDNNKCLYDDTKYGYSATFEQIRHLGDKTKCCISNTKRIIGTDNNVYSCDPKYKNYSSDCLDTMISHCSINNNIFEKQECEIWCNENKEKCDIIKSKLCNNLEDYKFNEKCKNFCLSNAGRCDTSITEFCNETLNQNDNICSCVNSLNTIFDIDNKLININPKCINGMCMQYGYLTKKLNESKCPNYCINNINIRTNNNEPIKKMIQNNNCQIENGDKEVVIPINFTPDETTPVITNTNIYNTDIYQILVLICVFIALIIIIYII